MFVLHFLFSTLLNVIMILIIYALVSTLPLKYLYVIPSYHKTIKTDLDITSIVFLSNLIPCLHTVSIPSSFLTLWHHFKVDSLVWEGLIVVVRILEGATEYALVGS